MASLYGFECSNGATYLPIQPDSDKPFVVLCLHLLGHGLPNFLEFFHMSRRIKLLHMFRLDSR